MLPLGIMSRKRAGGSLEQLGFLMIEVMLAIQGTDSKSPVSHEDFAVFAVRFESTPFTAHIHAICRLGKAGIPSVCTS